MSNLTILSTRDEIKLPTSALSISSVTNCSVSLLTPIDSLRTRSLADKAVVRVTRTGAPGTQAIFLVQGTITPLLSSSLYASGLLGVKHMTPGLFGDQTQLDIQWVISTVLPFAAIDAAKDTSIVYGVRIGEALSSPQFLIKLPPRGIGPDIMDIGIGRLWWAPCASVAAPFGAEWNVVPEANEQFAESRGYQAYSRENVNTRDRLVLPLRRVTQYELGEKPDFTVMDFCRQSAGNEVIVGRGPLANSLVSSNVYVLRSTSAPPNSLIYGRIDGRPVVSRTAGHLHEVDMTVLESR